MEEYIMDDTNSVSFSLSDSDSFNWAHIFGAISSWIIPTAVAFIVFELWLFQQHDVKQRVVQLLFSGSFSLSFNMLLLVIFEIVGFLSPKLRYFMWQADLIGLTILLLFPIPIMSIYMTLRQYQLQWYAARFMTLLIEVALLLLYWRLGVYFPVTRHTSHDLLTIEGNIARIGIVGVTAAAVLSGYGAVSTPYNYITAFLQFVSPETVSRQEKNLLHTTEILLKRKKECLLLQDKLSRYLELQKQIQPESQPQNNLFSFLRGIFGGTSNDPQLETMKAHLSRVKEEIAVLSSVSQYEFLAYNDLLEEIRKAKAAHSLKGRFYNMLGWFLSAYGLYRVVLSTINVLFSRDPTKDPITRGFEIGLTFFRVPDAHLLVQPVSFVFVGILVFSNVRGFLLNVSKVFKVWSSTATSNIVALVIAAVMDSYFLSTILLMRMAVPPEYRTAITRAVGDIEFNFFHRWFDVIFILSAVITIIGYMLTMRSSSLPDIHMTHTHSWHKRPDKLS